MNVALRVTSLTRRMREAPTDDRACRNACERELVRLYQADPAHRADVVDAFLPFAASLAVKLKRGEEPLEDLRQVALLALLKALDRFDPTVGDSFVAFAAPTILGELRRHYRDTGWAVHVPRSKQELAQKLARAERELTRDGRAPRADDIADRLGLSIEDVLEGRRAAGAMRAGSLDRPARDDDAAGTTVGEMRGAVDEGYARVEERVTIGAVTGTLSERDRQILALRYGRELSQREIGRSIGVSQMHVSRLLQRIEDELHRSVSP